MTIQQHPSPNHGSRYGWKPDRIVNHITAGSSAAGALAVLCDPAREVSAHFVVDKDGTVYQLVALDRAAWANGTSTTPSDSRYYGRSALATVRNRCTNADYYTISIEHVCASGGELTAEQLAASIELHRYIIAEVRRLYGVTIPVSREYIIGHCEINPVTKPNCPGAQFPYDAILEGLRQVEIRSDTSGTVSIKRGDFYTAKFSGTKCKPAHCDSGYGRRGDHRADQSRRGQAGGDCADRQARRRLRYLHYCARRAPRKTVCRPNCIRRCTYMEQENNLAIQALDSARSAHHRLDRLESDIKDIHDLATAMAATQQEVTGVQADIREIKQNVSALTKRPGKWWDKLVGAANPGLAAGLVGAFLTLLL